MNRDGMVRRAASRWLVSVLESSKSSNVDMLDLLEKFNSHSNSDLGGLRISEGQLLSILELNFPEAKIEKKTGRIHNLTWKKPKVVEFKPIPTKSPEDSAMEIRMLAFFGDRDQRIRRGEAGFSTADFANYRQSWLTSAGASLRHDRIDPKAAQAFLERCVMVECRSDGLWWTTRPYSP
jgi:hypothetical protein